MAPLVSQTIVEGLSTPKAYDQVQCYESAVLWAKTEGVICAPETSHAIAAVIEQAKLAKEEGKEKVIVFCFSGHGLMDLAGYERFFEGELSDYTLPKEDLQKFLDSIAALPKPEARKTGKW